MAKINLQDGELARMQITKEQEVEISKLYHQTYLGLKKEMEKLSHSGTTSESLRKTYLNKLVKQLKGSYQSIGEGLEKQIQKGMLDTAQAVVDNNSDWLKKAGLKVEGSYSYVPQDIVSLLSSGKLYGEGWSLSKAIWGDSQKKAHDIDQVVAAGVAANKPAYEIAKDLEQYVNPDAKKGWEWSKVYPGTSKKVDYNAQRLARTMVSHAYQQSLLATTKHNPFVTGYRWRSAHVSRTCELCNERDGQAYSANDLPLDHPNGLCTFLVELSGSLTDVADRLGDWTNGASDPELDKWYNSMRGLPLDYKPKAGEKAKATKENIPIISKKWVDKNLSNLRKGIQKSYGKDTWDEVRDRLLQLEEKQLQHLAKGNSYLKNLINDQGKGYWMVGSKTISIDLLKDMKGVSKSPYTTLFHEYGHLLDSKLYKGTGNGRLSSSREIGKPIYKLIEKEYNKLVDRNGKIPYPLRRELGNNDLTNGVQDIISGMSKDANRIKWGHTQGYWTRVPEKEQWKEVTSEAFAHLNAAYMNPEIREEFTKYFPETYQFYIDKVVNAE